MKKLISLLFLTLLALSFGACKNGSSPEAKIQVSLMESDDFTVEKNGIWVEPGWSVIFVLHLKDGTELDSVDYDGPVRIWKEGGATCLELSDIRYPVRARVTLTSSYRRILYEPNGGSQESGHVGGIEVTYDTKIHTRPNTSIGTNLFWKDGCTLTGWNTAPDGSGERIGLGSRVTVPAEGMTLYAQWSPWNDFRDFSYLEHMEYGGVAITGWHGASEDVVIPERINGRPVTAITAGAFVGAAIRSVILPKSLKTIEDGAFAESTLQKLLLFDNIESVSDAAFSSCENLQTLYINAIEAPYGYLYRRESVYADKVDLLIAAQGRQKIVFYGGCSMWYNLDGEMALEALGDSYVPVNMGLNGTSSSLIQMKIMEAFLEEGDIFFHTPEFSSTQQLMTYDVMSKYDNKLWSGIENNYDLFALVDLRGIDGVFDSLCSYLVLKTRATDYRMQYRDSAGRTYLDAIGSIPYERTITAEKLVDKVYLDSDSLASSDLSRLASVYRRYMEKGVRVLVSYSCVNIDAIPVGQKGNIEEMDRIFHEIIGRMEGPILISSLSDYIFQNHDFYDTNYHLLSASARRNTAQWLFDLETYLTVDEEGRTMIKE